MYRYNARVRDDATFESTGIKGIELFRGKRVLIETIDDYLKTAKCKELKRNAFDEDRSPFDHFDKVD